MSTFILIVFSLFLKETFLSLSFAVVSCYLRPPTTGKNSIFVRNFEIRMNACDDSLDMDLSKNKQIIPFNPFFNEKFHRFCSLLTLDRLKAIELSYESIIEATSSTTIEVFFSVSFHFFTHSSDYISIIIYSTRIILDDDPLCEHHFRSAP